MYNRTPIIYNRGQIIYKKIWIIYNKDESQNVDYYSGSDYI